MSDELDLDAPSLANKPDTCRVCGLEGNQLVSVSFVDENICESCWAQFLEWLEWNEPT